MLLKLQRFLTDRKPYFSKFSRRTEKTSAPTGALIYIAFFAIEVRALASNGLKPRRRAAKRSRDASSLDHLVGAGEQRWRDFEAERLCRFKIDYQLEFGRLLYRQISRLVPFENTAGIDTCLAVGIANAGSV
jgi:hypothetical protein